MAIQKINLGTEPLGEGGDTYRSANTKINENFSNPNHAASKLVGKGPTQIALNSDSNEVAFKSTKGATLVSDESITTLAEFPDGGSHYVGSTRFTDMPFDYNYTSLISFTGYNNSKFQLFHGYNGLGANILYARSGTKAENWLKIYHDKNTTKDSKTNLLLASGNELPENSAARRLVGIATGQVPMSEQVFEVYGKKLPSGGQSPVEGDANLAGAGTVNFLRVDQPNVPNNVGLPNSEGLVIRTIRSINTARNFQIGWYYTANNSAAASLMFRHAHASRGSGAWYTLYSSGNTKLDTNGAIAPSSPTIDLYSDRIEANADGEKMNPEFVRNGVGDYTIKNTTGLRDEGWYIKIPNDMNGNPKVAVTIDTDKDGNLNVKTYKRTFSLETFTFGPDLDEPLDIPEGRWIDLRFNDLPQEEPVEEPVVEEEPIVDEEAEPEVDEEPTEEPSEESE